MQVENQLYPDRMESAESSFSSFTQYSQQQEVDVPPELGSEQL